MKRQAKSNTQKALLVIDIQHDFTGNPNSPYKDTATFINTVNHIIAIALKKAIPIIYIKHSLLQ